MIYILLPAYNEEASFGNLLPKIDKYFKTDLQIPYQLIICNDGSTAEIIINTNSGTPPYSIIYAYGVNTQLVSNARIIKKKCFQHLK